MRSLEGMKDRHAPLNDWIHGCLRPTLEEFVPIEDDFTALFDRFEYLCALAYMAAREEGNDWAPPGAWGYRSRNRTRVEQEIAQSLAAEGTNSFYVRSTVFGTTPQEVENNVERMRQFASRLTWW